MSNEKHYSVLPVYLYACSLKQRVKWKNIVALFQIAVCCRQALELLERMENMPRLICKEVEHVGVHGCVYSS